MTIGELLKIFIIYKRLFIIILISSIAISAIIAFFIIDPIYLSSGTVKAAGKSSSGLGGLISGSMPDLGEIGDLAGVGSGAKELALYENILTSRKNVEAALLKFKLNDEWEYKYMYDAVKNFRENVLDIKKDKVAGTMEIGIYDKNPVRAKEIAEFMIQQLNDINVDLNVKNARNNREFIQSRYDLAKIDLRSSEDSLRYFQDRFGIAPELVVKAAAQAEIQLDIEIKSEEVKLELLRKMISSDQPEIKTQEEKIIALKNQRSQIQNTTDESDNLSLKGKPEVVMNFLRLQRNVEIQNKILTFLIPLFEQAKIEEKRETPTVLILDSPNIPDKKVKPKRIIIILLSSFISVFLLFCFLVLKNNWKRLTNNF